MKKEKSAGVIVYIEKPDGKEYLLLNYPTGHWDFVKGKIEDGEDLHQTAVRETKEETGISDLVFINGFEEKINYNFQYDGELIEKEVVFFLAKTKTQKVNISYEHLDYTWLNYHEALEKVTYQNARNILAKANNYL
ncbi:MAG TPA: bis(5'-nucleosyl)-tetraphosphatase [Nitrosopumilaceae archaeon]|nr:bis(5'-nucleosyl)-tetraphosphatase [Nitrosopumilaceae archaeon]